MPLHDHLSAQVAKGAAKHKAKKEASKKSSSKTPNRMTIENAENGFMTTTHYDNDMHETGKYVEPEKHIHKNAHELSKHIKNTYGSNKTGEGGDEA
jgi:hypothetical protein